MAEPAEEGVTIVLSPVQLAAVFEQETVMEGGTIGNRLIGALRLLGCGVEVLGAAALAAAPEPTMLTKAGAIGLAAHAADQCTTGSRQLWTGRDLRSMTELAGSSAARALGANPQVADGVGMVLDVAVPTGLDAGIARAIAIRAGRISLIRHEATAGSKIGGHTIERHVAKSTQYLEERFAATAHWKKPPPAISTFDDLAVAENSISKALRAHRTTIEAWARSPQLPRLPLEFDCGQVVGRGILRSTGQMAPLSKIRVVLKMETYNGMPYYVLTAYPIP